MGTGLRVSLGVSMAPSNPKRPPRGPPPEDGPSDPAEDTGELPFDEREATPLNADDPAPQRVTTYPARPGRKRRGRDNIGSPTLLTPFAEVGTQEIFLYAEHGPGTGQLLPVRQGALVMGRSSSCDLRLPHASISRRHARLTRRGEQLFVEDLGSQNGTFIDDERLSAPRELQVGQRIHIGPAVLRLRVPGGSPVTQPARKRVRAESSGSRQPGWLLGAAAISGFLMAAALGLWAARIHPEWVGHLSGRTPPVALPR
jgi:pSer/pThr/pTyr-binding forkhead associated (FHA) protein